MGVEGHLVPGRLWNAFLTVMFVVPAPQVQAEGLVEMQFAARTVQGQAGQDADHPVLRIQLYVQSQIAPRPWSQAEWSHILPR